MLHPNERFVYIPGFDEAEGAGDAHGVEDVDGLRGDGGVRQEREHHLLPGRRQSVEPRRADEPQELQERRMLFNLIIFRLTTPRRHTHDAGLPGGLLLP